MDDARRNNNKRWNYSNNVIAHYCSAKHLQPGEATIRDLIDFNQINNMIDIGVGGGRTTRYFSELVDSYLGVDVAEKFILHLQNEYKENSRLSFRCADILTMQKPAQTFDLVLFSHNGIDNLLIQSDWAQAVSKMFDLCSPGGYVCFSSHNNEHQQEDFVILDGSRVVDVVFPQVYTRPKYVYQLLCQYKCSSIHVIDREGSIIDPQTLDSNSAWLYYMCKKGE